MQRVDLRRYSRQVRFPRIGEGGQKALFSKGATVLGCGALGSVVSGLLVRAGVGRVRIVDRDYVELENLQRQILFDEEDVRLCLPKAVAAARKLAAVNSQVCVEPVVADVDAGNIESILDDIVLDGTDNFETRLVLNDACVRRGTPWVYGGAVGSFGMCMAVVPGKTACLRCLMPQAPIPGSVETCDTAGIVNAASSVIGSLQAAAALKLLVGESVDSVLLAVDPWQGRFQTFQVPRDPACECCGKREFRYLEARASMGIRLCGRSAVMISPAKGTRVDLAGLEEKLTGLGTVLRNEFLLRACLPDTEIILFPDGRAIVKGTDEPGRARSLYAKYVGV